MYSFRKLRCSSLVMAEEKATQNVEVTNSVSVSEGNGKVPNFRSSVRLKYVKLGFRYLISNALYLLLVPLLGFASVHLSTLSIDELANLSENLQSHLVSIVSCSTLMVFLATIYFMTRPRTVYLVDFSCYKPNKEMACTREILAERVHQSGFYTAESIRFMIKILERSGLGQETYFPEVMHRDIPNPCMADARKEAEMVMFGAIDQLLNKTKVKTRDIGILVVNCSLFNPTPSLSAMIVNHYKLRGNIQSYNLSGMGCSAGVIAIDLVRQLLQVHSNTYALVVSTENMSLNGYFGNNRSMLVTNCLFRMGGAAILLSSQSSDRHRSKYQLVRTVRTHKGADDKAYNSVLQQEDDVKKIGIALSKDLMVVAGEALRTNITTLGPLVLPMSEQLLFFVTLVARKVFKMKIKQYIPDFKLAFEHFCIHAGGRAVLDEIEKSLGLTDWHMEPSRMTLYRYGNTSSSSIWYELAYSEAKGRIRRGDRTWQIAFGSGFKCNSAVWKAIRTINPAELKNAWMDEIHHFPVDVPKVASINGFK